jgi:hypothetical protein
MNLYILLIISLVFLILFFLINKSINIEHFCKIPEINNQGGINDKRVLLNYAPQSNIYTSDCDKYWKDWPMESNNDLVTNEPIVMHMDQMTIPPDKDIGNNNYKAGFIDFYKLTELINDNIDYNILDKSKELLINPLNKEQLNYQYELNFILIEMNRKTYIDRWKEYNPSEKMYFNYNEIKSEIEDINKLNLEFLKRCNIKQKELLTNEQLLLFGILKFDIFKFKILKITYLDSNIDKPVYIIQISLYRETDLYLNTFSYIGFIKDHNINIVNSTFIGINSTDQVLQTAGYDNNEIKQEIINKNFSNAVIINKNPDAIIEEQKKYVDSFKLKNQYACFNINYDPIYKNNVLLPYYSREMCESLADPWGKAKDVGIYDKPCEKDNECPFYQINQNYENEYGKCINGKCELPINMDNIGYHFFKKDNNKLPLCYNCKADDFKPITLLDTCCSEQYDRKKYPLLKSPDYAFNDDYLTRINYFRQNNCKKNVETGTINCDKILINN